MMVAGRRSNMATKKLRKRLNLALQGGGAHGAYTWGVLDRLLEEEDIDIAGISGTSAGAMNAAVLIDGFMEGGRARAKTQLHEFWYEISQYSSVFSPVRQNPFEHLQQGWNLDTTAAYGFYDMLSRMFSPYELNPLNINPLKKVLENVLDVKALQACSLIQLFVTATEVATGQPRVFKCDEITVDTLLASACIPFLFQAVELDGEAYWDGGYVGNPSIWPLIYNTSCNDILLVQINPVTRTGTPKRAVDIINRLNEISFNTSLISEMRAIHFVSKLIDKGDLDVRRYKRLNMHMIEASEAMHELTASSKMNADFDFFLYLHGVGYDAMEQWLKLNKKHIGNKTTFDMEKTFLHKSRHTKV
jgi:NTE family protein